MSAANSATQTSAANPVATPTGPYLVNVKTLLDAGAHYGHQTQRWNPKMLPFIYGERNGVHIINLDLTVKAWERARKAVVETVARGGQVLFVGTKHQSRDVVREEATRCGAFYVTDRWLGGTMSNFQTIRMAIDRMRKLEDLLAQAEQENTKVRIVKKERVAIGKELEKLVKSLGGIRDMRRVPNLIFVTDLVKEEIAVAEARKLHIPVVGIADTNSDPRLVQFPIPSNDDAPRVTRLLVGAIADAVIEGKRLFEASEAQNRGGSEGSSRGRRRNIDRGDKGADKGGETKQNETEATQTAAPAT